MAADGLTLAASEIPPDIERKEVKAERFCFLAFARENYMIRLRSGR